VNRITKELVRYDIKFVHLAKKLEIEEKKKNQIFPDKMKGFIIDQIKHDS